MATVPHLNFAFSLTILSSGPFCYSYEILYAEIKNTRTNKCDKIL